MNFSKTNKLRKCLSLIVAMLLVVGMFSGCFGGNDAEDTSEPDPGPNLVDESTGSTETTPSESEPAVINENMATVTSQMNVRSSPDTGAAITGTLYAGDKVEVIRQQTVLGIKWGYITSPTTGWVCMDFIEMDYVSEDPDETTGSPEETTPEDTKATEPSATTQNIKGVVTATQLNIRSTPKTGTVQGAYVKGDVVTILETKDGWGRTSKGWISMEYVNTTGTTTNNTNNTTNNTDKDTTTSTGNGSTTVIAKGIVTASELNIRQTASTTADKVGSLKYGERVEILEKNGTWGRVKQGWISLDFVYQDGTTGSNSAKGIVTGTTLNIRTGPGTGYGTAGSYAAGDRVTILEQFTYNGTKWGCTSKGWISMDFVYVDGTDAGDSKTGTVTGDQLRVRSGPGTGYDAVGTLNSGDTVTVLYQLDVGGTTWGCIKSGWISMDYVDLD